jgi:hypothetical protein
MFSFSRLFPTDDDEEEERLLFASLLGSEENLNTGVNPPSLFNHGVRGLPISSEYQLCDEVRTNVSGDFNDKKEDVLCLTLVFVLLPALLVVVVNSSSSLHSSSKS